MWGFLRMIRLGNTNQMLDIKFQQYCAYRYNCHQHLAWQLQGRLVCNLCWHDPPGNATPVRETSRAHCSIRPARYCISNHLGCHGLECGHLEGEKTHREAFQRKNRPRPSIQAHGHGWRQDAPDTWAHATGRFCGKIKQNVTLNCDWRQHFSVSSDSPNLGCPNRSGLLHRSERSFWSKCSEWTNRLFSPDLLLGWHLEHHWFPHSSSILCWETKQKEEL